RRTARGRDGEYPVGWCHKHESRRLVFGKNLADETEARRDYCVACNEGARARRVLQASGDRVDGGRPLAELRPEERRAGVVNAADLEIEERRLPEADALQ